MAFVVPMVLGVRSQDQGQQDSGGDQAFWATPPSRSSHSSSFQLRQTGTVDSALGHKLSMWSWNQLEASGEKPNGREGHAMVTVNNTLYVIGGCIQEIKCFNDVHIFDPGLRQWKQEPMMGDAPEPRGGHTATVLGTDIFVFGGASSEATYNDVYKLDLIKRRWTRAVPTNAAVVPSRRTNHAAAADAHGKVYIFGGYDSEGNFLNDLWILNAFWQGPWDNKDSVPILWEHPVPTGQIPLARESHSLNLVRRKLVLFGGYTAEGRCAADVHVYDVDSQAWHAMESWGDAGPAARQAHSAARHGTKLIIAGGCDVAEARPTCYNDVWILDTDGMQWTQSTKEAFWSPREGHTATFVRGQMFVFGGCQLTGKCYNDVVALDTLDPCPDGCGENGICFDQSFCECSHGFTGHDCLDSLTCPMDCSGHGSCSAVSFLNGGVGQCNCENGFAGSGCTVELKCPGLPKCSNHGTCQEDGTCRCLSGYSGADCSSGVAICPMSDGTSCSGHGVCQSDAKCTCHDGWAGDGCNTQVLSLEERCAMGCCGRGHCGALGCECAVGWHGPACNINTGTWMLLQNISQSHRDSLLQEAKGKREQAEKTHFLSEMLKKAEGQQESSSVTAQIRQLNIDVQRLLKSAEDSEMQAKDMLKLNVAMQIGDTAQSCAPVANKMSSGELLSATQLSANLSHAANSTAMQQVSWFSGFKGAAAISKKNMSLVGLHKQDAQEPSKTEFGMDKANPKGKIGMQSGQCSKKDNCNYRGICKDGICYCQKNYYGPTCGTLRENKKGTIRLAAVALIAVGCTLFSFIFTLCFLNWTAVQRRSAEAKLGFVV